MGKSSFERSQKAHLKLNRSWREKGNTDKNRAYENYHADCYNLQREKGRVLSLPERKKNISLVVG